MIRSIKISLGLTTNKKLGRLIALISRLKKYTNKCISYIWETKDNSLAGYKNVVNSCLTCRQQQSCWRQALSIVKAVKQSERVLENKAKEPKLKNSITLSNGICSLEMSWLKEFDYILKISGLVKREQIIIPFKSHKRLNYWLSHPGAKLKNGCIISKDCKTATLWIDVPTPEKNEVEGELGFDINYATNLLTDSKGKVYGEEIKEVCENVRRKKPGSKGKKRAQNYREQYINKVLKQIPWTILKTVAFENLKNLKKGKSKKLSKKMRKRLAPWTYPQVLSRAGMLAQENGVRLELVAPQNTSKRCPRCSVVANENREGEKFCCITCSYSTSSGHAAAQNIIDKATSRNYQEFTAPDSCEKSKTKIATNSSNFVGF